MGWGGGWDGVWLGVLESRKDGVCGGRVEGTVEEGWGRGRCQ